MKKGEIWLVELPSSDGHEQMGVRPALVIADVGVSLTVILPFTSNVRALRFPSTLLVDPSNKNGLGYPSVLLIPHVRAIDQKRFKKKIGMLEQKILHEVTAILKKLFAL